MADVAELERHAAAWRAQRYAALRRPRGWLSLVGLDWLTEGRNVIGTDAGSTIRLTDGPLVAGAIELEDGIARATSGADRLLLADGEVAAGAPIVTDREATDERPPTLLELGARQMHVIRRGTDGERFALRSWDTASPAIAAFDGIPHWPVDPAWAIEAEFVPSPEPRTIRVPDVVGDILDEPTPGAVRFAHDGARYELDALVGGDDGELWLIFADATNGAETYGAGRFLYTDAPHDDGTVLVDFNLAYNPPCVFSPFATCPLPPARNRLPFRIEAGEQLWRP